MRVRRTVGSILGGLSLICVAVACSGPRSPAAPLGSEGVLVLVSAQARPEHANEVAGRFRTPQSRCSEQVGCLGFDIYRSEADPARVYVLERWASHAAHRAFFDAATSRPSFATFLELLAGDLRVEYLTPAEDPAQPSSGPQERSTGR